MFNRLWRRASYADEPNKATWMGDVFIHDPEILKLRQVFWYNQKLKPGKHKGNRHEPIRNECGAPRHRDRGQQLLGADGVLFTAHPAAPAGRPCHQVATRAYPPATRVDIPQAAAPLSHCCPSPARPLPTISPPPLAHTPS